MLRKIAVLHLAAAAAVLAPALLAPVPASAQARDPLYSAARAKGEVGEQVNGYLGFVTPPAPELRKVIEDINIKRRAVYADKAKANNATIEEYALTSGCLLISHTSAGEKYQAPDGSWQTRGANPPMRDPRCP
ncbi:hypothetical protein Y88_1217 [Novosphingobium nitrogenifigens DSM 19370]|uniref:DUF1318 domain-containing protein n=1 Tax=Novosphingobium nitrogenifigens DSM 19370 TaxID=983920 RepID=F1Z870_9SPHN|nr:YdbL family protein [Novosphingobium nitrogenifigens]EGD59155.1 hypothetical protein Y88_1217 [Novosphingobium nitrogenifigens DSM 19370]